eukprot:GHVT01069293.1.p1 GENE.GHVT01069293.1~~GHVT01069293.1.p1  ORF type:complete len:160 (-),score=23.53 GHVT01069293.1:495-974(-)
MRPSAKNKKRRRQPQDTPPGKPNFHRGALTRRPDHPGDTIGRGRAIGLVGLGRSPGTDTSLQIASNSPAEAKKVEDRKKQEEKRKQEEKEKKKRKQEQREEEKGDAKDKLLWLSSAFFPVFVDLVCLGPNDSGVRPCIRFFLSFFPFRVRVFLALFHFP